MNDEDAADGARDPKQAARRARIEAEAQSLAQLGSFWWSADTGVTEWSDECFYVLGYEPGSVQPCEQSLHDALLPEDLPSLLDAQRTSRETQQAFDVDVRFSRPAGGRRHARIAGTYQFRADGELTGMVGVVQDVSELRRRHGQSDGALVASVAHDLNNLFGLMLMLAEQLGEKHDASVAEHLMAAVRKGAALPRKLVMSIPAATEAAAIHAQRKLGAPRN